VGGVEGPACRSDLVGGWSGVSPTAVVGDAGGAAVSPASADPTSSRGRRLCWGAARRPGRQVAGREGDDARLVRCLV